MLGAPPTFGWDSVKIGQFSLSKLQAVLVKMKGNGVITVQAHSVPLCRNPSDLTNRTNCEMPTSGTAILCEFEWPRASQEMSMRILLALSCLTPSCRVFSYSSPDPFPKP